MSRDHATKPASPLRFFLGVRETAGYFDRLGAGLRGLRYAATSVDLSGHPFGYEAHGWWLPVARTLAKRRMGSAGLARGLWRGLQWILTASVMVWALPRHDVFILASLPPSASVPAIGLLRLFRKRVIVVFNGSDSRPPYLDGYDRRRTSAPRKLLVATTRQRRAVRAMERWAHVVVSHTASSHFLTRPFVPFLTVGVPALEVNTGSAAQPVPDAAVRILHAPSDPVAKGSAPIRSAVSSLMEDGMSIEFVELSGASHARVIAELARADIVIDQLYSDQPMPGLATEASSLGKAVIIGGYEWGSLQAECAQPEWPPTIQVQPDDLRTTILTLVKDRELRISHGRRARQFVKNRWTPRMVAERFVRLAVGDYPSDWLFEPNNIRSAFGSGMDAATSRDLIESLISLGGVGALGLSHAPDVERRIAARARERPD